VSPDAEAVKDVHAVHLVLDGGGGLERGHQRDPPLAVGLLDVPHAVGHHHEVLVGQVAQPHAQVVQDVVPLPAGLRGDRADAVHQVVEHAVEPRGGEALVAREVAAPPLLLEDLADVLRRHDRMVVHRDHDVLRHQALDARLLLRGDLHLPGRHAAQLLRQVEAPVVGVLLEVLVGPVTRVLLVRSHGRVLLCYGRDETMRV
jgi:hypothetical protein